MANVQLDVAALGGADTPGPYLQYAVEQFLYHEAELLDEHKIGDWVALMAEDVRYFMPIRTTRSQREAQLEYTGDADIAFFDETKASLDMRWRKLQTGMAWAETPPSRTRHIISNVRVGTTEVPGELTVRSSFIIHRNRLERQTDVFAGERHDTLRRVERAAPANFEIVSRRILLDAATLTAANISIFI